MKELLIQAIAETILEKYTPNDLPFPYGHSSIHFLIYSSYSIDDGLKWLIFKNIIYFACF